MKNIIYYHGGIKGLKAGEYILPPIETKSPSLSDFDPRKIGDQKTEFCDKNSVYITTDITTAKVYAAMNPCGCVVYKVEPLGNIENDIDCNVKGLSFKCESAKIISAHKVKGKEVKKIRKWLIHNHVN